MASTTIAELNPGAAHSIMLLSDGTVWTWGIDQAGQLGTGSISTAAYSSVPSQVYLPPIKQVAGGAHYSMALSADGRSIYTWGDNTKGELGIGDSAVATSTTPVEVNLNLPPGVTVESITGGLNTAYALLSTGQVMAWGFDNYGQAGQNPNTAGSIIYQPEIIPGLYGVTSVSAGDRDATALTANGDVWAWGENNYGQLGPNGPTFALPAPEFGAPTYPWTSVPVRVTGLPPIEMLASGGNDNIAVDANGSAYTWGRNEFGELGWGTVDPANGPHAAPQMVVGLQDIVSVDSEGPTTLAADASGNVYAFGDNKFGEVGNGTTIDTGTPNLVLTIPPSPDAAGPSAQVAAGHFFSFAFNAETGQIYAWGKDASGQLGLPANVQPNPWPVSVPGVIPDPAGMQPITVSDGRSLFVGNQQTTYWGLPAAGIVTVVAGGGDDLISQPFGATYDVALGNGNDTVNANGSGTVTGGAGSSVFWVGGTAGDANVVDAHGAGDTIVAGAGAATINAFGADPCILCGPGSLEYIGGSPGRPTVFGGTGTATLFAGAGQDVTYLTGTQDVAGRTLLLAGAGSDTLDAGGAAVGVQLAAGVGTATMLGSSGDDQFFGGSGVAWMTGNGGHDVFTFAAASEPGGQHGGTTNITDFNTADDVFATAGYGAAAAQTALLTASVSGGNTTVRLSDGTTIEFLGVANPSAIMAMSS